VITYKCKNCGGEMSVNASGDLYCPFCGSKSNFSDKQLENYKAFRLHMLSYLEALAKDKADESATRKLWDYSESRIFKSSDGADITVMYLFRAEDDGVEMFMAKDSVIYVFTATISYKAKRFLDAVGRIAYPAADVRNLSRYIPSLKARIDLEDNGVLLAFNKTENMYPLGAFDSFEYEHAAWLLSRLENLACLFEYNDLVHNGMKFESVFVNPLTHEAALYGGWWNAEYGKYTNSDLFDIRKVILKNLGRYKETAPKAFTEFLELAPKGDAYDDFAAWDKVIEESLGGHKFKKFSIKEGKKEV